MVSTILFFSLCDTPHVSSLHVIWVPTKSPRSIAEDKVKLKLNGNVQ